jgi:isoquinoline 1-oxidoreductase subunit beta
MTLNRREFLQTATALSLPVFLPISLNKALAQTVTPLAPNAFVRIAADSTVTVIIKHLEMGQGVYTGLAAIVADELDANWAQVRCEAAPADAAVYNNTLLGPLQGTGGSTAIANSWGQLRTAGAQARAVLLAAAATEWKVDVASLTMDNGMVRELKGKRTAPMGQFVAAAAQITPPKEPKLKDPKQWKIIGKSAPRKDTAEKINGKAKFGMDVQLPGQLTAVFARPARFGGKVVSFDSAAVNGMPGVKAVVETERGVAVLATNYWAAKKGRDALKIVWDESQANRLNSTEQMKAYRTALDTPSTDVKTAVNVGDAKANLANSSKQFTAYYEFPYLAHAAMEPLNCTVQLGEGSCEMWYGAQFQTFDQGAAAAVLGITPDKVKINTLLAGGSFGRRANSGSDFVVEAVTLAKKCRENGITAPIKVVWTREDDMQGGKYRPAFAHKLVVGVDKDGMPLAWQHDLIGQSIVTGTPLAGFLVKDGVDQLSVEGAANLPYAVPHLNVGLQSPVNPVPVLWWRSVGSTHTAFSTECMIDELAVSAKKDPVAYRLALLAKHPRHAGVLKLVAEKANWSKPLAADAKGRKRGRGIAVHEAFHSYVAQVVEVTVNADKSYQVDRVVSAVDCGIAVTPDVVKAQVEGAVGFALSAAMFSAITLKDGLIEQNNFTNYPQLRISEMPVCEVHIVASAEAPTGIGEPGVPCVAPALANALFMATGQRLRNLPLALA